jgi:hypothetical protein
MALACAGLADDQGICPVTDELQGVQIKARCARQFGVKAPVKVDERCPLAPNRTYAADKADSRRACK